MGSLTKHTDKESRAEIRDQQLGGRDLHSLFCFQVLTPKDMLTNEQFLLTRRLHWKSTHMHSHGNSDSAQQHPNC
jgi:hypothetical protein